MDRASLRFHEIATESSYETVMVDLLLARYYGRYCYRIIGNKNGPGHVVRFWGTDEEFEEIVDLLESVALEKLNEAYMELLEG